MGRASKVNFKAQGAQNSVNSTEKAARNPKQGRTTSSWIVKQRKPEIEAIAKVAKEKRSIIDRPNEERKKWGLGKDWDEGVVETSFFRLTHYSTKIKICLIFA